MSILECDSRDDSRDSNIDQKVRKKTCPGASHYKGEDPTWPSHVDFCGGWDRDSCDTGAKRGGGWSVIGSQVLKLSV